MTSKLAKETENLLVRFKGLLWSRCILRSVRWCAICGLVMKPRGVAFRPITNGSDRAKRMCLNCAAKRFSE